MQLTGKRSSVPRIIFGIGIALLVISLFRPEATFTFLAPRALIILVMDISGSMAGEDIVPTRMAAALAAANGFIEAQPADVQIGLVAFAEAASLVCPPSFDKDKLKQSLAALDLQGGTAIGSGILQAIRAIEPAIIIEDTGDSVPIIEDIRPPGSNKAASIILMSDGQVTNGPNPLDVARLAANLGIRIYTIGFGSEAGSLVPVGGYYTSVTLDVETLTGIAEITHGKYFHAATSEELQAIYTGVTAEFVKERSRMELTALLVAAASVLMTGAVFVSVAWYGSIF